MNVLVTVLAVVGTWRLARQTHRTPPRRSRPAGPYQRCHISNIRPQPRRPYDWERQP